MFNAVKQAKEELSSLIHAGFAAAFAKGELPEAELMPFVIEIPSDTTHGDFATNAAMVNARAFRKAPKMIAEILLANIDLTNSIFERIEVAGPGFINFFVKHQWFSGVVSGVLSSAENYGRSDYGKGQKIMVEFVSANPTGPMHMGNARGGAVGDGIATVLDWSGHTVSREFYINDAGNQVEKFGQSLEARYIQALKGEDAIEFPEDGYHGDDIKERAAEYIALHGDKLLTVAAEERRRLLVDYALPENVRRLKADLERYRINYDVWFKESSLHDSGAVKAVMQDLTDRGLTYEKDGALWYKATEYGGEKDEVLVRGNGFPTYFAADIAYHVNKFKERGFDRCINIWGADHHGHIARLKGAMDAVGVGGDRLDIVIIQLVRLMRGGEPVRMSKRTGKSVTLSDLLDDVPIDAARFFFNMREASSNLDFDLDLAVEQSSQNPVYYVQYAHARICSIIANLKSEGVEPRDCTQQDLSLLVDPAEIELTRILAALPEEIIAAAKTYDPARLTHYVIEVATAFHRFYNTCRCKVEDECLMQARLNLCIATRTVIANTLKMLKIDAPVSM